MEKFIPMTSGYCPRLIPMVSGDAPHLIHIHNIEESSDSMEKLGRLPRGKSLSLKDREREETLQAPNGKCTECNLYSDITGHTSWCSRDKTSERLP